MTDLPVASVGGADTVDRVEELGRFIQRQGVWPSHVFPALPVVVRLLALQRYRKALSHPLKAPSAEGHRTWLMGLAGFSLAGLAMIASSPSLSDVPYAAYDLIISFCLFFAAMGIQSWKARFWHDQLGDGLRDAAGGGLVVFLIRISAWLEIKFHLHPSCVWVVSVLASLGWLLEWGPGVWYSRNYAGSLELAPVEARRS